MKKILLNIRRKMDMENTGINKYYTPEIEEFHVGFEYEFHLMGASGKYKKDVWKPFRFELLDDDLIDIVDELEDGFIRVKYLDREDIESLGFSSSNFINTHFTKEHSTYDGYKVEIQTFNHERNDKRENKVRIFIFNEFNFKNLNVAKSQIFIGDIKNKSELKRILKQIGV